jgi:hypothetical protein
MHDATVRSDQTGDIHLVIVTPDSDGMAACQTNVYPNIGFRPLGTESRVFRQTGDLLIRRTESAVAVRRIVKSAVYRESGDGSHGEPPAGGT